MKVETHINSRYQYVYKFLFICHPSDRKRYYQSIKKDIFSVNDQCMIFSEEKGNPEEIEKVFNQINMVLIPITSRLLKSESKALDIEVTFALKKHIPILPIVVEKISGFSLLYDKRFPHIQYLDKTIRETTGIPYIHKLKRTIELYTVGLDQEEKIRAAFEVHVFLSYRKKDRAYAEELLAFIHQKPENKDIAVWYDEFLNPGERWNDRIKDAIDQCDAFSIIVTPNVLEEGNFVQQKEYPRARRKEKEIKPVMFEKTDISKLKEKFPGIPDPVPYSKQQRIADDFNALLRKERKDVCDKDLMKQYYMGLAYLYGVGVEIDREYAVEVIEKAAMEVKTEPADPLKTVAEIYRFGNGTARDIEKAVTCMERYVDIVSSHSTTLAEKKKLIEEYRFLRETMTEDEHHSMRMWEEHTTDVHPAEWKPYDPYGIIKTGMNVISLLEEIQKITAEDHAGEISEECLWITNMFNDYHYLVTGYIYEKGNPDNPLFYMIQKAILQELKDNHISINKDKSIDSDYWKSWKKYSERYFSYVRKEYKNRYKMIKKLNKNVSYADRRAPWSDYWMGCGILIRCYTSIKEACYMLGDQEIAEKYSEKCLALMEEKLKAVIDYSRTLNEIESWSLISPMFYNLINIYMEGAAQNLDKAEKLCRECLRLASDMKAGMYPLLKTAKRKYKFEAEILESMARQKLKCIVQIRNL